MKSRSVALWRLAGLLAILALLLIPVAADAAKPSVTLQILNVSDWHGQIDPLLVNNQQVGGAAVISAYWKADRLAHPNTLTLTAGDDFGATPPIANFFDQVPAILAQRMMGIQVGTFGNHNFDRGIEHLQCMIDIAAAPNDPSFVPGVYSMDPDCPLTGGGPSQPFAYVSANLKNRDDNLSGVEDFKIFDVGGVKVAVIGITNPEAPTLVFPGSFGTIVPTNPVPAANKARAAAKHAGAEVFIAITHMGVTGFIEGQPVGPLINFANNVGGFDVIVGDHTDIQYSGIHNNALVYENRSKGLTYARALLTVRGKKVTDKSVEFVTPFASAVTPDPAIAAMRQPYAAALAPVFNTVIGSSTVFIPRADACGNGAGRTCESRVGNVTTDALRTTYGTDFAITNSGGLRADLTCPTTDNPSDFCPAYTPPPFPITRGQVLTVLPFGNIAVTLNVNGAELKSMLENGISVMPGVDGRFPQVSGLCFTYDISAAVGNRVTSAVRQAADGSCTGAPVDLTAASSYTLAENDFMANGGDGYPNLASRMVTRDIMDSVVADYITANSPISPAIQGRIACTTSGATPCPVVTP